MSKGGANRVASYGGGLYQPELGLIGSAKVALSAKREVDRARAEATAKRFLKATIGVEIDAFEWDERIGEVPSFVFEDEVFAVPGDSSIVLVEWCHECGGNPYGRPFNDLASLGLALENRDDTTSHVCAECSQEAVAA